MGITLQNGSVLEPTKEELAKAGCFSGRDDIVSVEIPRGVKIIRKESFMNCGNLKDVVLPIGLKAIEANAFYGCGALDGIALPESLQIIESGAFAGTGIKEIIIPEKVAKLKKGTFSQCKNLKRLVVPRMAPNAFDFTAIEGCKIEKIEWPDEMQLEYEEFLLQNDWRAHMCYRSEDQLLKLDQRINDEPLKSPLIWQLCWKKAMCGPYHTTKQAYEGLMEHIDEMEDKDMFVKNLIFDDQILNHSFYPKSRKLNRYIIVGFELKGLQEGMPFYLVQADVWHSSSFHPFNTLFGIFGKASQARTCCRNNRSFNGYPISQEKPQIIEYIQNDKRFHKYVSIDYYHGFTPYMDQQIEDF